jgi:hypothetical protein
MSQSTPVPDVAPATGSTPPPIVGATNLLKKPAALPMVDSNLMIKKLVEARGIFSQVSKSNLNHPHLPLLKLLIDLLEAQNSALFLFMQQQQNLIGGQHELVKVFQQVRNRQAPLEEWMQRVQDATVIMDVKIRFPEVGQLSTEPFLPLPGSEPEDEKPASSDPGPEEQKRDVALVEKS